MAKPSLPQGTRDFGPDVVRKRSYILNTIKNVFELYGFQPLETPAMENIETLMGKYGDEGDKLIFKILNNGLDNPGKEKQIREDFEKVLAGKSVNGITERALKYDLTIPFARYVAMNHNTLTFPFKRYQIQPVWRADRPQKGRYREFYQCDADVVGSNSLLNEIELVSIYNEVFVKLGLADYELRINHRQILSALAETCGSLDKMMDITIAIDKLDKIGLEKVKEELINRGLSAEQTSIIEKYLSIAGSNEEVLSGLSLVIGHTDAGGKGIEEIKQIVDQTSKANVVIDPTLARGLNYYTGIIFEAKGPKEVNMGSIGGGGRYDDLTGLFGVAGIPGVGISFGVDRIYDVMEELKLFPDDVSITTQVLFFNLGEAESKVAFGLMQRLRNHTIRCELYHETAKFDKQFKYAEKKNIPFVIIIGEKEIAAKKAVVKDIRKGEQQEVSFDELISFF